MIEDHENSIVDIVKQTATEAVKAKLNELGITRGNNNLAEVENTAENIQSGLNHQWYTHHGMKRYVVPLGFKLPKSVLATAFLLYANGDPTNCSVVTNESGKEVLIQTPIRPFYFFSSDNVPKAIWNSFHTTWKHTLMLMTSAACRN